MKIVTRKQLEIDLAALAGNPQAHMERSREYGRSLRNHRVLTGLGILMARAEQGGLITYPEFSHALGLGSHWERSNVLKEITILCVTQKWPCYPSLVVQSNKQVSGEGLLDTLAELGLYHPEDDGNAFVYWDDLCQKCYNTPLPAIQDVLVAMIGHVAPTKARAA